ncbi:hypothetical protein FSS13T_26270 [Flavobacterium saliperosum S13]|uniref:DUF5017 domain-containing protein n=2 Tax=Flavobacterium saliperosum TaxID=329186 RepID=A0A1G4W4F7_9FLAO|nr:choice-of-anchor J domain-containing protein [Flavobacterium saliperosum]ESU21471.1 hypothetical protein FSS13T_26270 [Flavobacterium saliperosum S13]SCX16598.1 protein of unknown function [Flavobacterium saliperosum]
MKKIFLKPIFILSLSAGLFTGCVNEDEFDIPTIRPVIFTEDFNEVDFNQVLDYEGWTNFAEAGTKKWIERDFNNDGYAQFSSFGSGEASNIGWLISPAINMDANEGEILSFQSASNFVDNANNKLEVFVSSDYDGTNVLTATWVPLNATVADNTTNNYTYIPSGNIDLSTYTGTLHIAFKVTGNGSTLDGLFQVDKIKVYSLN